MTLPLSPREAVADAVPAAAEESDPERAVGRLFDRARARAESLGQAEGHGQPGR